MISTPDHNARALAGGFARSQNIDLTPEGEAAVVSKLQAALRYDEKGRPYLVDDAGNKAASVDKEGQVIDLGFAEFVAGIAKSDPTFTRQPDPAAPKAVQGENITERMRVIREAEKTNPKRASDAITTNPFRKDTWNLSAQMLLKNQDPQRAQKLQALARAGQ